MKIGFSTTASQNSTDISSLSRFRPEIIEICGCKNSDWRTLCDAVASAGIPIGLHCPAPFDGWPPHFEVTGPNADRQRYALSLIEQSLAAAEQVGALYVVVHFPSVIRETPDVDPLSKHGMNSRAGRADALASAQQIAELSDRYGVAVMLENVAPNPYFGSSDDFCWLFEQVPSLSMCLDFGHVHVVETCESVYQFADNVAGHVSSMHVYNASTSRYTVGRHDPPFDDYPEDEGWMDLELLLRSVQAGGNPEYLIFEYTYGAEIDIQRLERNVERLRRATVPNNPGRIRESVD